MAMVALVVVALAVTGNFCLENKTPGFATVMMMMRHNGVKHDNCTCQRNHCLLNQMFHTMTFASPRVPFRTPRRHCKDTTFS